MNTDKTKLKYCGERGCPRSKLAASNWLDGVSGIEDCDIVEVTFKNTRAGFYRNEENLPLKIGDIIAVEGNPGHDIGRVSMIGRLVKLQMQKMGVKEESEIKKVFRFATQADMEKFEEARSREHSTMIRTRKIAEDLNLDMKIGDVEYQGDGGKAIFYYIADERVDFRKLIRVLAETFKVRVEMKQIGARQEAGRIGGIGPCGRPLCCASWMTHFVSVGTGAARLQDLSMNPQKLAGQCGKLKCCLNFETDVYAEAQKEIPAKDIVLQTKDNDYYLFKTDILAREVTYSTDKKIPANLVTINAKRAFEVIALNKQGVKVDTLLPDGHKDDQPESEYVDLLEQESLTRFDKSKRKRNRQKENKPKDNNKPKVDNKPKENNKPKADTKPKENNKPKADNKPKENNKPKVDNKPKENNPKGENRPKEQRQQHGRNRRRNQNRKDRNPNEGGEH